jgi:hypothetical protein
MSQHRCQINNLNNCLKLYESIRNNGGIENFKFEILTEFCTSDIQNKFIVESHYIRTLNPPLNIQIPLRTTKQYYKDNIVSITEHKSKKNICSCGGRYRTDNFVHHIKTNKHLLLNLKCEQAIILSASS